MIWLIWSHNIIFRYVLALKSSGSHCTYLSLVWQVPFKLRDEDIPDDWSCERNIWDREHASCSIPRRSPMRRSTRFLALQVSDRLSCLQLSRECIAQASTLMPALS